jgi:ribosomal protein S18 acetylase RimI-like enzyme
VENYAMTGMTVDGRLGIRSRSKTAVATIAARGTWVGPAELYVHQLGANDLIAVERYLLGLGPSDRYARFLGWQDDAAIIAHVRGVDPVCTVLVGAFDQSDRMAGLAEAYPTHAQETVEIAVSVKPAFRRRGLGRRLVTRALVLAFARGAQSAELVFGPDNCALARLVQCLGGRVSAPGHAVVGRSNYIARDAT